MSPVKDAIGKTRLNRPLRQKRESADCSHLAIHEMNETSEQGASISKVGLR